MDCSRIWQNKALCAREIKIALRLKCSDRNLYDFLDCLVGLDFLERQGLLETARYTNTEDTAIFLDKAKPSYIGGLLEMQNNRGWEIWGNLDEALKTGLIQNEAKDGGEGVFDILYQNPDLLKEFVNGMTGVQMGNFIAFSKAFGFSDYKTLVDAGGSAGVLSVMVAKNQPHMNCTSFDLPALEDMANATIQQFQMSDRVKAVSGDFFKEGLPN